MANVLGVGDVFFKSPDPQRLYDGYAKWRGMKFENWGTAFYPRAMSANGQTVWSAFDAKTDYFAPSQKDFMFNLVVDDLEEALRQVEEGGTPMIGKFEKLEYGSFCWFIDRDGNKVELWEPSK